jgi:hypothetical protein
MRLIISFMKAILFLSSLCFLCACRLDERTLQGDWQAVAFFENGQRREIDLSPVRLSLSSGRHYVYESIGLYREEGSYRSSMHYLFLTDTSRTPPVEHIVKVLYLSPDSLKIRMQQDSSEQVLWLARRQPDSQLLEQ